MKIIELRNWLAMRFKAIRKRRRVMAALGNKMELERCDETLYELTLILFIIKKFDLKCHNKTTPSEPIS